LVINASEPVSVTKNSTTLTERATLRTITLYGIDRPAYEAEFATLTSTATDTDHTGYTGTGFVDQFETAGDAVTFEVYAPEGATYSLDFRYTCAVSGGATRNIVDLDNNSSNNLSVNIYVHTDAQPTSVTGTSLNWSYDSTTGRVRLYGTLNASASNDITINF
jgi:hypothetical protein